jgi:hypothetical protein
LTDEADEKNRVALARRMVAPGDDHPVGEDPDAEKRELERGHCDPAIREPFIWALTTVSLS